MEECCGVDKETTLRLEPAEGSSLPALKGICVRPQKFQLVSSRTMIPLRFTFWPRGWHTLYGRCHRSQSHRSFLPRSRLSTRCTRRSNVHHDTQLRFRPKGSGICSWDEPNIGFGQRASPFGPLILCLDGGDSHPIASEPGGLNPPEPHSNALPSREDGSGGTGLPAVPPGFARFPV